MDQVDSRVMQRTKVALLCVTLLVGVVGASLFHTHAAAEHQHGAQNHHHHESLLHVHLSDGRTSDAGPHAEHGDHGHDDATAFELLCVFVRTKGSSATPVIVADTVRTHHDPVRWSSLDLAPENHAQSTLYLITPSLRGPPTA